MKNFSLSTILGLTLGVLLAGYAVFAFTPPTVAPTGGNTLAPINVGAGSQVKQGGLWLNNGLIIDGGLRIGLFSTASRPACVKGTIIFDTTAVRPYICDGTSWNEYKGSQGLTGSTGATGPLGSIGPQGPPGPTEPVATGLYGSCQEYHWRGIGCGGDKSPAFCSTPVVGSYSYSYSYCSCPSGYEKVETGTTEVPSWDATTRYYLCYKN